MTRFVGTLDEYETIAFIYSALAIFCYLFLFSSLLFFNFSISFFVW